MSRNKHTIKIMARCRFIQAPQPEQFLIFRKYVSKNLSRYLDSYENITWIGDYNMTLKDRNL